MEIFRLHFLHSELRPGQACLKELVYDKRGKVPKISTKIWVSAALGKPLDACRASLSISPFLLACEWHQKFF